MNFKGAVSACEFSPCGRSFAVCVGKTLQIWATPTMLKEFAPFRLLRQYGGMYDAATCVGWSADSRWVVVGSKDLTARCSAPTTSRDTRRRRWRGTGSRWCTSRSPATQATPCSPSPRTARCSSGAWKKRKRTNFRATAARDQRRRRKRKRSVGACAEALFPPAREADVRELPPPHRHAVRRFRPRRVHHAQAVPGPVRSRPDVKREPGEGERARLTKPEIGSRSGAPASGSSSSGSGRARRTCTSSRGTTSM